MSDQMPRYWSLILQRTVEKFERYSNWYQVLYTVLVLHGGTGTSYYGVRSAQGLVLRKKKLYEPEEYFHIRTKK
jgi:hypothetical protein